MTKLSSDEEARIVDLAERGDRDAQAYLGWAYDRGGSLSEDVERAEYWLRRAAQSGRIEATRNLARYCVAHQRPDAVALVNQLIDANDFAGHYLMGHILRDGICGASADREAALRHFRVAADMGHLVSKVDLLRSGSRWGYLDPVVLFQLVSLLPAMFRELRANRQSPSMFR